MTITNVTKGEVISIGGKSIRGSKKDSDFKTALHVVSAFENGVCLGQEAGTDRSNEITAISALLELLSVKECILSRDEMGCPKYKTRPLNEMGFVFVTSFLFLIKWVNYLYFLFKNYPN